MAHFPPFSSNEVVRTDLGKREFFREERLALDLAFVKANVWKLPVQTIDKTTVDTNTTVKLQHSRPSSEGSCLKVVS